MAVSKRIKGKKQCHKYTYLVAGTRDLGAFPGGYQRVIHGKVARGFIKGLLQKIRKKKRMSMG